MHSSSGSSYEDLNRFSFSLGEEQVMVVSKPGLLDWDSLPISTRLLAEYAELPASVDVMLYGCHHGALTVFISRHLSRGKLWATDRDALALEMTRQTLAANQVDSVTLVADIELPEACTQQFDTILIQLPKGRKLTRRWLLQAHHALKDNGQVFIAGAKDAGIQSAIHDAIELIGEGQILGYKKGHRVAKIMMNRANFQPPAWAEENGIAPGTWKEFSINLCGRTYLIHSLPGIFSYDHLDPGTLMLLERVNFQPGARVLDVGCGYGIIGMYAAVQGAGWVDLLDSDLLAVAAANETLRINQINNASVHTSDLLTAIRKNMYDLILSNPPFHAGLAVDYQIAEAMIRQSHRALMPGGQLILVGNRFIPYDRLIEGIFANVCTLSTTGRFHVLCGVKSGN